MKRLLLVVAALAVTTLLAAPVGAGDVGTYEVDMDGAREVPGPGDPDGTATMTVVLGTVSNEVCVDELVFDGIEPTAAHIHAGASDEAGPVVVDLTGSLSEIPSCTLVSADLMRELVTRPECYYVNVHTAEYPDGAVRGQLVDGECEAAPATTGTTITSTTTTAAPASAATGRPRFTG